MEKKEPYIVAWTDEDGMRYERFPSLEKAQGKLCSLFEEQAGEEYSDDGLGYYVEKNGNRNSRIRTAMKTNMGSGRGGSTI